MTTVKKTYSLPESLVQRFEKITPKSARSTVVSKLIEAWLENQNQETLQQQIMEGCQDMREVYLEIEKEYHPLEEEVAKISYE